MATMLGSLLVSLGLESAQFERNAKKAQGTVGRLSNQMKISAAAITASAAAAFVSIGKASIEGAVAQRQAVAQVEAALASMGNAAGRTSQQLVAASDAMELRSLFDGDVILKQVTANLLTFGNIAGEQFDRAQQAAIDMATRLGGEPQAAAIMLGKALNDPIKGITALTRVGVQFTAQQKEQIAAMAAAGDTAGAQAVILAEVERQFRGAAAAAADASPYRVFQVIMGQIGDVIGEALLPSLYEFRDWLLANREQIMENVNRIGDFMGAMFELGSRVASVAAWVEDRFAAISRAVNIIIAPLRLALSLFRSFGFGGGGGATGMIGDNPAANALRGLTSQSKAATETFNAMGASAAGAGGKISGGMGAGARAVRGVGAAAVEARDSVADLMEALYPENITRRQRQMADDVRKNSERFADPFDAVLRALGAGGDATVSRDLLNEGPLDTSKVTDRITEIRESMEDNGKLIGKQTVTIAESFAQMSQRVTSSLQGLANSIRSGDFFGILGGVLDIFTTLGSAGVFGSGLQGRLNRVPGNANGTRNFAGGLSVVGERGPELVNLPRRSQVIPNHKLNGMGGGGIAQIVPSPYFDVVVDGRVMRAAPMVANAGAMQAQSKAARSARRRVR